MHWVVQSNMYAEAGFEQLLSALQRLGISHSVHKVVPFSHALEPEYEAAGPTIVMGTLTLCRIARERGWHPGAITNDNFDYRVQVERWGDAMLNADAVACSFGYVSRYVPQQVAPFFMRPVHDTKAFTGLVVDWPTYMEWRDKVAGLTEEEQRAGGLGVDTLVMIARHKEIHREYRLFVVDGKVVTGSLYKIGSRATTDANVDPRVVEFAEATIAAWAPALAFALDVADTPDGLKVIEVNCINSAGWYAADLGKIVMAMEEWSRGA